MVLIETMPFNLCRGNQIIRTAYSFIVIPDSFWLFSGINAGLFARELMNNCERLVADCRGGPAAKPTQILSQSAMRSRALGSSTALVAFFDGQVPSMGEKNIAPSYALSYDPQIYIISFQIRKLLCLYIY